METEKVDLYEVVRKKYYPVLESNLFPEVMYIEFSLIVIGALIIYKVQSLSHKSIYAFTTNL